MENEIAGVMFALEELSEDDVPKNVKIKAIATLKTLQDINDDGVMKVSRALHELEGLAEDCNIDSFTRSKLFNIVSLLESATLKKR